jgi:hypothetical protein
MESLALLNRYVGKSAKYKLHTAIYKLIFEFA